MSTSAIVDAPLLLRGSIGRAIAGKAQPATFLRRGLGELCPPAQASTKGDIQQEAAAAAAAAAWEVLKSEYCCIVLGC